MARELPNISSTAPSVSQDVSLPDGTFFQLCCIYDMHPSGKDPFQNIWDLEAHSSTGRGEIFESHWMRLLSVKFKTEHSLCHEAALACERATHSQNWCNCNSVYSNLFSPRYVASPSFSFSPPSTFMAFESCHFLLLSLSREAYMLERIDVGHV